MKIRVKAFVYNDALKTERERTGLSQSQAAYLCGISLNDYASIERLELIPGKISLVREKLQKVCDGLAMNFEEAFPPDYLQMLADKKLPNRRKPFQFVREVALDELPPGVALLALPDPLEIVEDEDMSKSIVHLIRGKVATLPPLQQQVLSLRFGLNGHGAKTVSECAAELGISQVYVRQVEEKALRNLRHPIHSRKLRELFP